MCQSTKDGLNDIKHSVRRSIVGAEHIIVASRLFLFDIPLTDLHLRSCIGVGLDVESCGDRLLVKEKLSSEVRRPLDTFARVLRHTSFWR